MPIYRAKMKHTAATIRTLIQTQYDVFQFRRKIIHVIIAFALILFGVLADQSMFTPIIALFAGCFLIANINAVPRSQMRKVLQQMDGNFPKSSYSFCEEGFRFYDKGEIIPYSKLIRLVEDKQYLFLYISEQSAYMVDKGTVTGGSASDLKDYLSAATGLSWTRPSNILFFRLRDLFPKKEDHQGPRLNQH